MFFRVFSRSFKPRADSVAPFVQFRAPILFFQTEASAGKFDSLMRSKSGRL
jgi:hypothetical protein